MNFQPKKVFDSNGGERSCSLGITVLNNLFDQYSLKMKGVAYACDAVIDTLSSSSKKRKKQDNDEGREADASEETKGTDGVDDGHDEDDASSADGGGAENQELVSFPELNLAEGPASSTHTIMLKSSSAYPIKFDFTVADGVPKVFSFAPSKGHIGPKGSRAVVCTFATSEPVKVDAAAVTCALRRIEYKPDPALDEATAPDESSLWGKWDDTMKNVRAATDEDVAAIEAAENAMAAYT
jgi:hypothetical protein